MSVTKECRLCGRILEFNAGMRLQTCPACGSQNECPQMESLTLDNFRQAIRLRNAREFDRAEKSYDLVLNADPDNAEALWGRVLCHYGAAPVFDGGRTYYMIHRPDDLTPLQEQADYKYACQLAPPELRAQIENEGRYIDRAIRRIRELADTKPAYDVFLCHKCSRPEGGYTEDYKRANNLYMMLKEQGYRVFFAPVEMERRAAGEDYEAMIYHALRSSRVMLVVCSNREYLLSKWVQAEWQRFLRMIPGDPGKRLIPLLYGGMDVYRLPEEFRNWNLQCINMEGDGNALVLQNVQRIVGVRENANTDDENMDGQDELPPPPPSRNHFGRMLTALAVLAALVIGAAYFILKPPAVGECSHSSTSWRQVGVSYDRYSDEQHWVSKDTALFCDSCGMKLQTQTGEAYLEAHAFSGNACTKCEAKATPTPAVCQHPWSYVDWNDWQYAYDNEDNHQKWRTGEKRCGVCNASLGTENEPVTREEHSYWDGKCRYCGVQATPAPTACPHAGYNIKWDTPAYYSNNDATHTKITNGSKYCTSCEAYLGRTNESATEPHSYLNGVCRYCGVQATPAPTVCPHASFYVDWNGWEYSQYSDKLHTKWRSGDKYCNSCRAYLGPTSESATEAHTYSGGECRYCGVKTTPTPTPRPTFTTTLGSPSWKRLSYQSTVRVFSGPGTGYYRASNGLAECSVHRDFYVFGYENGWYMIRYDTNNGAMRVGYIEKTSNVTFSANTLQFAYKSARTNRSVNLTDDPDGKCASIATLSSGTKVTYLATYGSWYYVECATNQGNMRGFIPVGTLEMN